MKSIKKIYNHFVNKDDNIMSSPYPRGKQLLINDLIEEPCTPVRDAFIEKIKLGTYSNLGSSLCTKNPRDDLKEMLKKYGYHDLVEKVDTGRYDHAY